MGVILTGFALIIIIDMVPIIRRRLWREALAFLLLLLPALILAVLRQTGIQVPSLLIEAGNMLKAWGISY